MPFIINSVILNLQLDRDMKLNERHGINTKQPLSGVLCGNITLFGVAEDHLHPVGSGDPPPQIQ